MTSLRNAKTATGAKEIFPRVTVCHLDCFIDIRQMWVGHIRSKCQNVIFFGFFFFKSANF